VVDIELGTITGGGCVEVTGAGVVVGGKIGEGDGGDTVEDNSEEAEGGAVDEVFDIDGSLSGAEGDDAGEETIGIACGLSSGGDAVGAVFSFALESRDF
jgi:hypothetical protein